ncbi:MAG: hypothetical protein KKB66_08395 [Alphaproteobacteria bacterium]|jgi:hypothetical protein|nr:hypothetical protein [Alphaproteobacteria bacterium]MBU0802597.1 hypothetical protein [Alphaproteobacteria bacterium]MBU0871394.1 hypothetical protein [Alphaproteobacteria bacterium]MBU1400061.1 hypothetical protein [Alphaproteobacteria bacterium]MBU1591181.1 hypothetical protein [Alphaproteobacteria bacterium]
MRRMAYFTLLPLMMLAACQSTAPQQNGNRACTQRESDAGSCNRSESLSSFPELANVN